MADTTTPTGEASGPASDPPDVAPTGELGKRSARTETAAEHSVLKVIETRTGVSPKVMLSEEPSAHGAPPAIGSASSEAQSAPAGRGSYQLHGEIARGGMGSILKGHDTDLGRDVAIKVLLKDHADNPAILQRFVEEAQIGGQLQHPGIVPVYEMGLMSDDRPYFTMKLVKGRTLSALLSERKSLDDGRRRFLSIIEQVCQTMAYAHSRKVIHRDLKPANIMVGAFGEVQIVDWGLAKVIREGGVSDELAAEQTEISIIATVRSGPGSTGSDSLAGSVMGTPAYMSPEQAQGEIERLDERTDVFALGAILCQILTGKPPYAGKTDNVLTEAARGRLADAHERLDACGADAELVEITRECLTTARATRPRSAEMLAQRLSDYLAGVEERAREAQIAAAEERVKADNARRAHRLTLALAATVLIALVGAGGVYLWLEGQGRERAAHARRLVDEAVAQVLPLEASGRWDDAFALVEKAAIAARSPDADDDLRSYVAGLRERLRDGAARDERARAAREQDRLFLAALEPLRYSQEQQESREDRAKLLDGFASAFREYGCDVEALSVEDAAAFISGTTIAVEIAQALDEWARLETRQRGFDYAGREHKLRIAMAADPDPWRTRLREAVLEDDATKLRALAASDEFVELPPESIWTLLTTLWHMGHREQLRELAHRARQRYPNDFLMNFFLGSELRWGRPNRPAEGATYLMAAHALRPTSISAIRRLTSFLAAAGDYESLDNFSRVAVDLDPDGWRGLNHLAWKIANYPTDDPEDPVRAVQLARRAVENAPGDEVGNILNTLGVALYRAGELETAITVLRQAEELESLAHNWMFEAMAQARLGEIDEAQRCLEHARAIVAVQPEEEETLFHLAEAERVVLGARQ